MAFKNSFMEFMDFHQFMKFIMCSFADPRRRKSHPFVCKGPSSRKGPSVKMGVRVQERPTPQGWRLAEHSACKVEENLRGLVRASPKSARRTSAHFVECDRRRGQKRHSFIEELAKLSQDLTNCPCGFPGIWLHGSSFTGRERKAWRTQLTHRLWKGGSEGEAPRLPPSAQCEEPPASCLGAGRVGTPESQLLDSETQAERATAGLCASFYTSVKWG